MMYYEKHIFVCTNQKPDGKKCCANSKNQEIASYLKDKIQEMGCWGPGKWRVSTSGCLGRCQKGPCLLVYPDNIWYRIENFADADKIVHQHMQMGQPVKKLQILEEI
ncbi:MAG TPA: 2Fe-2S ferredoxin [Legionellales bacterium]|nr:2Fe-2S ferredoxin [Legionellales bacterium]